MDLIIEIINELNANIITTIITHIHTQFINTYK